VAKATGIPIAKIAARVMSGEMLSAFALPEDTQMMAQLNHVAVKEAVFPFARFPGVDIVLGPEMKSTGESMGIDRDFARAYAKAHIAAGLALPLSGRVFISVKDRDKKTIAPVVARLIALGFDVVCTRGTGEYLLTLGHAVGIVNKVREGRPHIVDAMKNGEIQLVFNTTEGAEALQDSALDLQDCTLFKNPLLHHSIRCMGDCGSDCCLP